jgi:hypothetical protein
VTGHRLHAVILLLFPLLLRAQGTTSAAMHGTVATETGSAIHGAIVRVTNQSNGRRWEVSTRSGGRFFFEDLAVGGPYRIDVRALGFVPEIREEIRLSLGERIDTHFALKPAAVALVPVTVTANTDATLNSGRVGPAEIVSRSQITKTPNLGRGFLTLTALSPQTVISPSSGTAPTGGITIAGQNRLLNGFSVDGGTNQDLYTGGLPGRETLPQAISLESIEEIQVLSAPFDIRYGGFAGGLVNAVTRSGENAVHGSLFSFFQNSTLTGTGVSGRLADFRTWQYGGSVGGPIVRDRAHYFVSLDVQQRAVPDPGPLLTAAAVPDPDQVTYADAVRFQTILRDTFNLEPGTLGPVSGRQPVSDIFGKIDVQLGTNSHVEISQHYAQGERDGFPGRRASLYVLSNTGQTTLSTASSSTLTWRRVFAKSWSSEFIVSHLRLNDECRAAVEYPAITVVVTPGGELWGGSRASCPTRSLVQNVRELTENATVGIGGHTVTLGMHGESLRFSDARGGGGTRGTWTFLSLDDFAARRAFRYSRTLPGSAPAARIELDAGQISAYAQDRWTPTTRLAITLGLRLDRHFLRNPVETNEALKTALGIDTGRLPGGRAIFSPRLGINYDLYGDGSGYLRGGIGIFAGRVPYVWLANAYRDNGAQELFLVCTGARAPVFDPVNQPSTCTSGPGPTTRLSFFDPGLKLPQSLKVALGADHRLVGGMVGTVDVLYNRSLHELYLTDANLVGPIGVARGEGNRTLYGTISSAGGSSPTRLVPALGQVARISNKSVANTLAISAQLRKRFSETLETSASYAFTRARDQMSLVNFITRQNLEQTPLDGTLEDRALRPSYFEVPHRLHLSATTQLWRGVGLSLLYMGSSGTPYTHVITGDPNADGIPTLQLTPDIVYVPMDSADIALTDPVRWAELNSVIEAEPCLRRHRGRILTRNSCRNPWFGTLNARLSKEFQTSAGQSLELTANVYNVLNLLNRHWGLYRITTPTPAWPMMRLRGYDTTLQRGIYDLTLPTLQNVSDLEGRWSRWLAELGIRCMF